MRQLTRSRPLISEAYGISKDDEGLLDWSVVDEALRKASSYWLATSSTDGRPHVTPIWGAWTSGHLYVEGGSDTRWAKNLAANPRIAVGVDSDGFHISVNGSVDVIHPGIDVFSDIALGYGSKYDYQPQPGGAFYRVTPGTILAHVMATVADFAGSFTRFRFEER